MPRDIARNVGRGRGSVVISDLKGIHQELTPNRMELNQFITARNVISTERGLLKALPWVGYIPASEGLNATPQWLARGFDTNGVESLLLYSLEGFQKVDASARTLTDVIWKDSYTWTGMPGYSCTASGNTLTYGVGPVTIQGLSTTFNIKYATMVKAGDQVSINNVNFYTVTNITGTVITVAGSPGWASSPTVLYVIRSLPTDVNKMEWANWGQYIIVSGENLPIGRYDCNSNTIITTVLMDYASATYRWQYPLNASTTPATMAPHSASTICAFRNWLIIGNTVEVDGAHPSRVRWSSGVNPLTDWTDATRWLDLPGAAGKIMKLLPLATQGSDAYVMCYMNESVYRGYQASSQGQPIGFVRLDTGGVGLISSRAVVNANDAHYFAGQDNIYVTNGSEVKAIGNPIQRQALVSCGFPQRVCAAFDRTLERVMFLIPGSSDKADTLWNYSIRTKEWTSEDCDAYFLATKPDYTGLSWGSFGSLAWLPVTWADAGSATWGSFDNAAHSWQIIKDDGSALVANGTFDSLTDNPIELVTSDIDFDQNDIVKDWFRLAIQIDDSDRTLNPRTMPIGFTVHASLDGGKAWRPLGSMFIPTTKSMGYVNFRLTQTFVRFKLTERHYGEAMQYAKSSTMTNLIVDATYAHGAQRTNKEGV